MKVPNSIRSHYEKVYKTYSLLKDIVDDMLRPHIHDKWFYCSRLKDLESFALKIETGRFTLANFDDLLGCLIVVPNLSDIPAVESIVSEIFDLIERKPENNESTKSSPDKFFFDDLRLYLMLNEQKYHYQFEEPIKFEIQVKTFLQHAWAISTHDLVYKTDETSWAKKRVAFQIKAMLEHAELSISEISHLSTNSGINRTDFHHQNLTKLITYLHQAIPTELKPIDMNRLAENIVIICKNINLTTDQFITLMNTASSNDKGFNTLNLSPYACVVQELLQEKTLEMKNYLYGKKDKNKIVIYEENILPQEIDRNYCKNALFI